MNARLRDQHTYLVAIIYQGTFLEL